MTGAIVNVTVTGTAQEVIDDVVSAIEDRLDTLLDGTGVIVNVLAKVTDEDS